MEDKNWFRDVCNKNKFAVSEAQLELLDKYVHYLILTNKNINLISRKDSPKTWSRHILGSVSFLFKFKLLKNSSLIDVGTGGGLPGIPIAILYPEIMFTLIDSVQKKINVVGEMIKILNLKNVTASLGRAEHLSKSVLFKSKFDYAVTRAVAQTVEIIKWTKPFLRMPTENENSGLQKHIQENVLQKGSILLLKGGDLENEISEATSKVKLRSILSYPISVRGIDQYLLEEKKIVIVRP